MLKIETAFGEVRINRKTYYSDMLVFWDGKKEFIPKFSVLDTALLAKALEKKPGDIVLFAGENGSVRIREEVLDILEEKGIDIFIEKNSKAAKIFNAFMAAGKKAAAIVHCGP